MQVLDEIKILSDKILEDRHSAKSLLDNFIKDKGKVSEYKVYSIKDIGVVAVNIADRVCAISDGIKTSVIILSDVGKPHDVYFPESIEKVIVLGIRNGHSNVSFVFSHKTKDIVFREIAKQMNAVYAVIDSHFFDISHPDLDDFDIVKVKRYISKNLATLRFYDLWDTCC
jgi:hypothetical protein